MMGILVDIFHSKAPRMHIYINFQAYYDGQPGPINGGTVNPGHNSIFYVPEGTEIISASVWLKQVLTTLTSDF